MLVAGQNYIDSSGSAIQCMQDKGNGEKYILGNRQLQISKRWLHANSMKEMSAMEMLLLMMFGI